MKNLLLVFLLLMAVLIGGCFLDNDDDSFTVSGNVRTADGEAVQYVFVRLGDRIVTTNTNGYYKFGKVAYNSYNFEAYINKDLYVYQANYTFDPPVQTLVVDEDKHIDFTAIGK